MYHTALICSTFCPHLLDVKLREAQAAVAEAQARALEAMKEAEAAKAKLPPPATTHAADKGGEAGGRRGGAKKRRRSAPPHSGPAAGGRGGGAGRTPQSTAALASTRGPISGSVKGPQSAKKARVAGEGGTPVV